MANFCSNSTSTRALSLFSSVTVAMGVLYGSGQNFSGDIAPWGNTLNAKKKKKKILILTKVRGNQFKRSTVQSRSEDLMENRWKWCLKRNDSFNGVNTYGHIRGKVSPKSGQKSGVAAGEGFFCMEKDFRWIYRYMFKEGSVWGNFMQRKVSEKKCSEKRGSLSSEWSVIRGSVYHFDFQ